jgi:site-specific DNA recombinase
MTNPPKTVRCAIYTRKSVTEGLQQEFNSLDAQREAAESFIASQRHEGWICLPNHYDDGGFSGGNADRPALKALMADVEAGEIDCIVVYKVDRLSRSLLDFSRIMGILERYNCSFVSVTQQFNTSHSMGRLTLNILLSFAQFEREIIAERTRDKVHSARRKGKWTGGPPMLGYDVAQRGGKLVVNEVEALQVRQIFDLYLKKKSITETVRAANALGLKTKSYQTRTGKWNGGRSYTKTSIYALLSNVHYRGKIPLKDELFEGEHDAIIDEVTWESVQRLFKSNAVEGMKNQTRNKHGALLRGILFTDPDGAPMYHTFSGGRKRVHRYYVHREILKRGETASITRSINAAEIESFVVQRIKDVGKDRGLAAQTIKEARLQLSATLSKLEADAAALRLGIAKGERELAKMAADSDPATIERMATLTDYIAREQTRLNEIQRELERRRGESLDERALIEALGDFDEIWEALTTDERVRMVQLLIERVNYNAEASTVTIAFRPTGIKSLIQQAS